MAGARCPLACGVLHELVCCRLRSSTRYCPGDGKAFDEELYVKTIPELFEHVRDSGKGEDWLGVAQVLRIHADRVRKSLVANVGIVKRM